jgi:hypothetical protein
MREHYMAMLKKYNDPKVRGKVTYVLKLFMVDRHEKIGFYRHGTKDVNSADTSASTRYLWLMNQQPDWIQGSASGSGTFLLNWAAKG